MTQRKILLASDLHYSADLPGEMAQAGKLVPAGTYNHLRDGRLVWHNTMMIDQMDRMVEALTKLVRTEAPDLLVFMGDVVNTNLPANVSAVAEHIRGLPCEVRLVTGNHDVYVDDPAGRLQAAVKPDEFATGLRHEWLGDLGLLYLDIFGRSGDGQMQKWRDPHDPAASTNYRPADVDAALTLLDQYPDRHFLAFGHFPMTPPEERLRAPDRKIGWQWPGGAPLRARVEQRGNLAGIVCGHQHFAHFQRLAHGFHWTLPPLVEYPCAAAVLTIDRDQVQGHMVTPDVAFAEESRAAYREDWTAGEPQDRSFRFAFADAYI